MTAASKLRGVGGAVGGAGPVVESSTTYSSTTTASTITMAKPAGTVSGDLLVAVCCLDGDVSTSWTNTTGWAEVFFDPNGAGRNASMGVYSLVAGGSEPSTYTFTSPTGSDARAGLILRISGQGATFLDRVVNAVVDTTSNATDVVNDGTPPSINFTPNVDNCLILQTLWGATMDASDSNAVISGYDAIVASQTLPGATTTPYTALCHLVQTTAAATGNSVWLPGNTSTTQDNCTIAISIAP